MELCPLLASRPGRALKCGSQSDPVQTRSFRLCASAANLKRPLQFSLAGLLHAVVIRRRLLLQFRDCRHPIIRLLPSETTGTNQVFQTLRPRRLQGQSQKSRRSCGRLRKRTLTPNYIDAIPKHNKKPASDYPTLDIGNNRYKPGFSDSASSATPRSISKSPSTPLRKTLEANRRRAHL